jgi:hypothetical protein
MFTNMQQMYALATTPSVAKLSPLRYVFVPNLPV